MERFSLFFFFLFCSHSLSRSVFLSLLLFPLRDVRAVSGDMPVGRNDRMRQKKRGLSFQNGGSSSHRDICVLCGGEKLDTCPTLPRPCEKRAGSLTKAVG